MLKDKSVRRKPCVGHGLRTGYYAAQRGHHTKRENRRLHAHFLCIIPSHSINKPLEIRDRFPDRDSPGFYADTFDARK
jgi:hypothetical protein